jgi:hypothetical protein
MPNVTLPPVSAARALTNCLEYKVRSFCCDSVKPTVDFDALDMMTTNLVRIAIHTHMYETMRASKYLTGGTLAAIRKVLGAR